MHTYMYLVTEWSRCSTRARAVRTPDRPAPGGGIGIPPCGASPSRAGRYTTTHRIHRSHTDPTPPHRCAWRGSRICRAGPRSAAATKGHAGREAGLCCLSTLSAFRTHTQHHDRREKRTRCLHHASAHPRRHVRRESLRLHVLVCGWARLKGSEEPLGSQPWLVSAPLGEADHDAAGERGEDGKAEHDVVARARDLAEGEHAPEC